MCVSVCVHVHSHTHTRVKKEDSMLPLFGGGPHVGSGSLVYPVFTFDIFVLWTSRSLLNFTPKCLDAEFWGPVH